MPVQFAQTPLPFTQTSHRGRQRPPGLHANTFCPRINFTPKVIIVFVLVPFMATNTSSHSRLIQAASVCFSALALVKSRQRLILLAPAPITGRKHHVVLAPITGREHQVVLAPYSGCEHWVVLAPITGREHTVVLAPITGREHFGHSTCRTGGPRGSSCRQ